MVNSLIEKRLSFPRINACKSPSMVDEEEGLETYFELSYIIDPMTNSVILHITDFANPSDKEGNLALWNQAISELKRIIGA